MEEEENLPIRKSSFEKPATKSSFDKLGKAYSNNLYYNTGFGKSSYDENFNFDAQFNELDPIGSINENRAQSQSNLAKVGAGIGRIGTKAVSEIAKMPGVVGGILAAPFAKEGEGWETAFNNQWVKSISQFNEDINAELLPVYVKKAVSEGNLWDNISSIDFWATEGADGIGFIASMFAPGAVLKSLNFGQKILGTTAKGLSMVNGEAKLAGAVRTLEGLGINANKIDMAGITMGNTLFESGSEAGSAMESFQKDIDRKLASGEINQQQYEQLQTQKAKLGRDVFVSNLAILLVPNAIQTKMIWGKGVGSQLVKDTPSLMAKIGNRGKNVLGALGSEGFLEEGSQSTVETMFSNKAKRGELTDNMSQDFNVSELVSSYIDTLNTTEGQKAIFLGGFLGGGMSAYQGGKSDIATRKETQSVLSLAEEKVGVFNKINETDVYKRDENGDIIYNYNNKPQYDPVKVRDVAKALDFTEKQSQLFDQAIQEDNTQVIQTLKNEAISQLITPFINKGELGIQALSQYLDTTLKTQEIAENEDAKALKGKIIEQATYMQDQLNSYKDFSKSLININNPNATAQDITDYYNTLGDIYINLKGSEYFQKSELKKLNTQKTKLLKDLDTTELSTELNPNYIEGKDEEIYKFNRKSVDPRIKLLNDQIDEINKNLSKINNIINNEIWNDEKVNESFNKKVKENNKLREEANPENEAVINQASQTVDNATTPEELNNLPKTNTPADTVIEQKADKKKSELKVIKEAEEAGTIADAKNNDVTFNGTSKIDITSTEGSDISDELTPQTGENTTEQDDKEAKLINPTQGKGVKLISYNRSIGEVFDWIKQQFSKGLKFERNPVNKIGTEVGFEINENPGTSNENVTEALKQFKEGNFKDIQFLIDYLPINIKLTEGAYLPIETRRVNGKINPETEMLRKSLITNLINGIPITDMNSTITGQYKGVLQVESPIAENSLLDLAGVTDLKYIKENTYFVNIHGQLENVLTGQTRAFQNKFTKDLDRTKNYAAGEIYLMIPQADGISQFPLKLNISKLDGNKSYTLASIYSYLLKVEGSSNMTLSEVKDTDLLELINQNLSKELKVIVPKDKSTNDVKLGEIIDLLVYESDKIKSRINITDGVLYYGEKEANSGNIDDVIMEVAYFLNQNKRHQIKIKPKTAEDNQRTNLAANSANYIKYLVEGKILSTNAVVNQPAFQGYTNLFISPTVTTKGSEKIDKKPTKQTKKSVSITEIEDRLKGVRTIDELYQGFKSLNNEDQDLYKPLFTEKKLEIENKGKVKVSDAGAEIASNNFEGLDFGDNKKVDNKTKITDIEKRRQEDINSLEVKGDGRIVSGNTEYEFTYTDINGEQRVKVSLKSNTSSGFIFSKALSQDFNSIEEAKEFIETVVKPKLVEKINAKYDAELKALENNSDNTRNIENKTVSLPESTTVIEDLSDSNKFVSSSDIPNTVENKQQMDKQEQVFKEPKGLEGQKDTKTITMLKDKVEKGTAIEANLKQLESLKAKYGEEYVKKCK